MARGPMSPALLRSVAARFRALAEPARLRLLDALSQGDEHTVSDLVAATGLGQANVSKHLQLLHAAGFVTRRRVGLFVHYRSADPDVVQLCDLMCRRLQREASERYKQFAAS